MPARQPVGTAAPKVTTTRSKRVLPDAQEAEVFAVEQVNASFLESLLGYNARRASLSLVGSNPGITSRQLCQQLDVLPPNMVGMIDAMMRRGFLERRRHPRDGRAMGLYLTEQGRALVDQAEPQLKASEQASLSHLSAEEQAQLMALLQKLYR